MIYSTSSSSRVVIKRPPHSGGDLFDLFLGWFALRRSRFCLLQYSAVLSFWIVTAPYCTRSMVSLSRMIRLGDKLVRFTLVHFSTTTVHSKRKDIPTNETNQ